MPRGKPNPKPAINEKELTKKELAILKSFKKHAGEKRGTEFFQIVQADQTEPTDPNIQIIEEALNAQIENLRFPKGKRYQLRRGRGRIIAELID